MKLKKDEYVDLWKGGKEKYSGAAVKKFMGLLVL